MLQRFADHDSQSRDYFHIVSEKRGDIFHRRDLEGGEFGREILPSEKLVLSGGCSSGNDEEADAEAVVDD